MTETEIINLIQHSSLRRKWLRKTLDERKILVKEIMTGGGKPEDYFREKKNERIFQQKEI